MKKAMEPERPSLRKIVMIMQSAEGEIVEWTARQARKRLPDGQRILTVRLSPRDIRGVALLVAERPKASADEQWIYLPMLKRVRRILPVSAFESFMGTDFTYADLGLVNLRDRSFEMLAEETVGDTPTYKIEEVPKDQRYYSRIVTWVAKETMLPLRRDFYDSGNRLWKRERVEDWSVIDGVPTMLRIRVEDLQEHTNTEQRITEVRYDERIPDRLFDPIQLPKAASSPIWSG
jgi:hypothetical protein